MIGNPKRKQALVNRIKTLEWSTTLINNLGFNLCVVPQSLVVKSVAYFGMERSHQNKSPRNINKRVQKRIVHWNKQDNDMPASNYMLKV